MPMTSPDSPPPPAGVPQMPAAPNAGPAPVPYGGPGWPLAPDQLAPVPGISMDATPGAGVMDGVTGANYVTEAPLAAPNVNPYEAGSPQAIYAGGDNDAGGRDDMAASVAAAVASAEARFTEHQRETYGQGSQIGDLMQFAPSPLDPGAGPGKTDPSGGYYDPPRAYGNEPS